MEIDQLLARLETNPGDWPARCAIAQAYYDAGQYQEAAEFVSAAPEVPFDEENVLFAATVLGTADAATGHNLLDQFIEASPTPGAYELKAQLFDMVGDAESAQAYRASAGGEPVPVAEVVEEAQPMIAQPRSLRPPGSEDEEGTEAHPDLVPAASVAYPEPAHMETPGEPHPAHLNMQLSQPIPLNLPGGEIHPAHMHVEAPEEHGEIALLVGEGEAVHGMEAEPPTSDRIGAITAAIIVHAILAVLLWLYQVAAPRPAPPQISVSSLANTDDASLDNTTLTKQTQKTAAAVSSSQPVISSVAFSSFAMPDMEDNTDLTMVSMGDSDAGFGMSMSGFGDVSNMGAIPAAMRSRCSMSERMKRLRQSGGEDRCERAVRKGLVYLTAQQQKDPNEKNFGAIGHKYTAGMTGLALLAYLGHCETPESPKFGDSVVNAALYLMERGTKNKGLITNGEKGHHEAYEHAIATYALCELYTMTKESGKEIPRLESVLKKAVGVIVDSQDKLGGWSYLSGGTEDMSVSGWNIQALKAAYNTGRKFSKVEKTLDKAVKGYLPKIQDGRGAFKYRPENADGKPTLTGAALLGMQIWDAMGSDPYNKGLAYLNNAYKNPSPGGNYYAPYYNTQVYFMHGGKEWENYNSKFQPRLLDAQNSDGSWLRPGQGHGGEDSQIMNTAWAILMLEVYYRYLPTTDKVKDLKVRR